MRIRAAIGLSGWIGLLVLGMPAAVPETNRFESEVRALESSKAETVTGDRLVMLYGSSSFRLWQNAEAVFPGQEILNHGFGGAHLADLNAFFERLVVPKKPGLVLIYGGDNDIAAGKSPETVLADFRALVRRFHDRLPGTRIAFLSIKPSPARLKWLEQQTLANRLVREFTRRQRRVDFLDVSTPLLGSDGAPRAECYVADRLHLSKAGYERWIRVLGPYLDRRARRRSPG